MITILKTTERGLETMPEVCKGCWINVVDPTPEELAQLQEQLTVPPEFLTYPLDMDERPRVERENGQTLMLLRVPLFQGQAADIPYTTMPLGIVLDSLWIMTICRHDSEIIRDLASGRVKDLSTAKRNRFILRLLLSSAAKFLSYLREINKAVDLLEDQLQSSLRNRELMGLLKYQKSLVYFTTALKSNELMMQRLQRSQLFATYPEDQDLLDDVLIEIQQAIEMTNIDSNILSSMMDAFASIISNNMNRVMKFLAAMTIVLTVPVLVASLYGMNVQLPLQDWPYAFDLILALSLGVAIAVAYIFLRRDWM